MKPEAIGLDVGGTKIAGFRVAGDGEVAQRVQRPTPGDPDAILAAMEELAMELVTGEVVAVGVGAAGMVDFEAGVLRYAPNLPWRDLPLANRLSSATGLPTLVDNDANTAAWAEYRFGAGRGSSDMLLVTVGTGIGGGIVSDGRVFRGAHGFAAEI